MYEFIAGKIEKITPTFVILENQGIGYRLQISLNTYSAIQAESEVRLFTLYYVREDVRTLFGFYTEEERMAFELFIGVSGIGPSTGQLLISAMTPAEAVEAVQNEDEAVFKSVKGIGAKTAKRLILDLKDKITRIEQIIPESAAAPAKISTPKSELEEARQGLIALGFSPAKVQKALWKIRENKEETSVENIIKQALKLMS